MTNLFKVGSMIHAKTWKEWFIVLGFEKEERITNIWVFDNVDFDGDNLNEFTDISTSAINTNLRDGIWTVESE